MAYKCHHFNDFNKWFHFVYSLFLYSDWEQVSDRDLKEGLHKKANKRLYIGSCSLIMLSPHFIFLLLENTQTYWSTHVSCHSCRIRPFFLKLDKNGKEDISDLVLTYTLQDLLRDIINNFNILFISSKVFSVK